MNKPTIYLDFDECLVDTMKSFCETYNEKFKDHKEFVPSDYTNVYKYNFTDQCPLLQGTDEVHAIFDSEEFFEHLAIKDYCIDTLLDHKSYFDYHIVTIGTPKNLALKSLWISEHLPFIQNVTLMSNGINKVDKSVINMFNGDIPNIFLDDHHDNLISSNANIKICMASYGDREWNSKWDLKVNNWIEFDKILDIYKEEFILIDKEEDNNNGTTTA